MTAAALHTYTATSNHLQQDRFTEMITNAGADASAFRCSIYPPGIGVAYHYSVVGVGTPSLYHHCSRAAPAIHAHHRGILPASPHHSPLHCTSCFSYKTQRAMQLFRLCSSRSAATQPCRRSLKNGGQANADDGCQLLTAAATRCSHQLSSSLMIMLHGVVVMLAVHSPSFMLFFLKVSLFFCALLIPARRR